MSRAADKLSEVSGKKTVESLENVFKKLINLGGSLIFCGVGKSGHIATKLSSTFTSLGCSSFFLHPTEALHGDLGRVGKEDGIIFLSKSGTTEEILKLLPHIDIEKNMRIGLLGNLHSPLAKKIGVVLDCSVEKEACINNQAPTTSSTLMLGMGDAMAILYEKMVGLSKEGFISNHPGGFLGKCLRVKVSDIMLLPNEIPQVQKTTLMKNIIIEMTSRPVGACVVLNQNKSLEGMIVEGDIRRTINQSDQALLKTAEEVMNSSPAIISPEKPAYDALVLMEGGKRPFSVLPVVDKNGIFLGLLRLHDLFKAGISSLK